MAEICSGIGTTQVSDRHFSVILGREPGSLGVIGGVRGWQCSVSLIGKGSIAAVYSGNPILQGGHFLVSLGVLTTLKSVVMRGSEYDPQYFW